MGRVEYISSGGGCVWESSDARVGGLKGASRRERRERGCEERVLTDMFVILALDGERRPPLVGEPWSDSSSSERGLLVIYTEDGSDRSRGEKVAMCTLNKTRGDWRITGIPNARLSGLRE